MESAAPRRSAYQPEIDGLRTIAVSVVVLDHAGFETFPGGFVGVDVFFVISGFLITRLIVEEQRQTGSFDFGRFYVRRIRRLFPALLSTIALSAVFALLLLTPEQMESFASSATAAVLSLANFRFWRTAGYFDALAETKPLLHTWSLAVEEQYYLLWPAALTLALRHWPTRDVVAAIAMLCVGGLLTAEWWLHLDHAGAFYLLPPRAFELGIGALLVWAVRFRPSSNAGLEVLLAAGVALIAGATLAFTDETPFPGVRSLVPALGAALAIFACPARHTGSVLRSAPFVAIGRISYSLYLLHWPIIVFYGTYVFRDFSATERWGIVAASTVAAALQYRFVEERFRHVRRGSASGATVVAAFATSAALVCILAGVARRSDGWPERIPEERSQPSNAQQYHDIDQRYCTRVNPDRPKELFTCQNHRGKSQDVVLWGDSHAWHLAPGFAKWFPDYNVHVLYSWGCVPQSGFAGYVYRFTRDERTTEACVERNRAILAYFAEAAPTNVVLSGAKRGTPEEIAAATREILASLEAHGHTAVAVGDIIRPGRHLNDCTRIPPYLVSNAALARRCEADRAIVERELRFNAEFGRLVEGLVSFDDFQCPSGTCTFVHRGQLLFRDYHHLNVAGAEYFVGKIRDRLPFRPGVSLDVVAQP
jgi:peptidoglycan/LPS O-acetylase OafA/YrhL